MMLSEVKMNSELHYVLAYVRNPKSYIRYTTPSSLRPRSLC